MASAGEFSFAIKAYDDASNILRKATAVLNTYRNKVEESSNIVKKANEKQAETYQKIQETIEDAYGEGSLAVFAKYQETVTSSMEESAEATKKAEEANKNVSLSVKDITDAVSTSLGKLTLGITGLKLATDAINKFGKQCLDVGQQTQITAFRIRNMATAFNTSSVATDEVKQKVSEFISEIDTMSPALIEASYALAQQGHNVEWVTENYKQLNNMALVTGNSVTDITRILGGSQRDLLELGIQADFISEGNAKLKAKEIAQDYKEIHGVAMDASVALAEARKEIYSKNIDEYNQKIEQFKGTFAGATKMFGVSLSKFQSTVGEIIGSIATPLINLGTTIMDFISNNKVLAYITAIGSAVSIATVAIVGGIMAFGKYVGQLGGVLVNVKNAAGQVYSLINGQAIKAVQDVLKLDIAEIKTQMAKVASLNAEIAVRTKKSVIDKTDISLSDLRIKLEEEQIALDKLANNNLIAQSVLYARGAKSKLMETIQLKYNSAMKFLSNTQDKQGIILKIQETLLSNKLRNALAQEYSGRKVNTLTKIKDMAVTKAQAAANALHLSSIKALTIATLDYTRSLIFGSKAGKFAAKDRIAQTIGIGKEHGIDLTPKGGNALTGVLSKVSKFGQGGIKGIMSNVGGLITMIGSGIATAIKAVMSALGPVGIILTVIGLLITGIIVLIKNSGLGEVFKEIGQMFQQTFMPLFDAVKGIFSMLGELFNAILQPIVNLISSILTPVINVIRSILEGAIMPILNVIATVVSGVLMVPIKIISTILKVIFTILSPIFSVINEIAGLVEPIFDELMPIIDEFLEPFMEILEPILEILNPILDMILDPILDLIHQMMPVIREIGTFIKNYITNPLETVMNIVKSIGDFFSGIGGAIGSWVSDEQTKQQEALAAQRENVYQAFTNPSGYIESTANRMFSSISNNKSTVTNNNGNANVTFNITSSGNIDADSVRTIFKQESKRAELNNYAAFNSMNMG